MSELTKEQQGERITKCFQDFSLILPIYSEEQRRIIRMTMKQDVAILIPIWFSDLAKACIIHQDSFVEYLKYISSSVQYMLGQTDTYEQPEYDQELYLKLMKQIEIQKIATAKEYAKNQPKVKTK